MTVRILTGDCRAVLPTLADESVHCIVTSPPYYGLRDYGTAQWEGGEAGCDHVERMPSRGSSTLTSAGIGRTDAGAAYQAQKRQFNGLCRKCGARRIDAQLGLEQTPDQYVAELVAVFRECRRVLRDDGVAWVNLGDSYAGSTNTGGTTSIQGSPKRIGTMNSHKRLVTDGLKPKDLIGIPWMVAFALRADGWYLRQDIIWAKPNPMPESVTDRCTKAHEYLFLLSKSAKYYYDAAAVAEESIYKAGEGGHQRFGAPGGKAEIEYGQMVSGKIWQSDGTRNRRSVWTVATHPFKEAHFATFPPALIEPCIKAGCPVGGTVLDPFSGAGTAGLVADRLGRNSILIELNPTYADMARDRITGDAPLFAGAEAHGPSL